MKKKRIVVIDDCTLTRTILKDILEESGYDVVTASSGIEANPFIFAVPSPALMIIDVEMPMLNGDRKVRLLKEREASRAIPVLLISAKTETELERLVANSGAEGYLQKPVNKEILLQKVRRFIP